jgi:hypothetical protein
MPERSQTMKTWKIEYERSAGSIAVQIIHADCMEWRDRLVFSVENKVVAAFNPNRIVSVRDITEGDQND